MHNYYHWTYIEISDDHNSRFLENERYFPAGFWRGKRVVDLGAGTGAAGLAAGTLG